MKVIFVASGNKKGGSNVSAFVQSQYDSLKKVGLEMQLVGTEGKGAKAYLRAAWKLRKMIRAERPDVVHGHYSLCGWVANMACLGLCKKPKIVVSILGSFPTKSKKWKFVRWSIQHLWDATIVKSQRTANQLGLPVNIIPNGVNLEVFRVEPRSESREKVGFEADRKYIIWCSNPERAEKNWPLAEEAVKQLKITNNQLQISLVPVFNKTPQEVCTYMNAAGCLLLTSWSEGSPNVIKEAMACNCPIVTTDVGDVTERLEGLDGCYVATTKNPIINQQTQETYMDENAREVAECLRKALAFGKRTDGRKRILADQLEISQIAKRIKEIYERI